MRFRLLPWTRALVSRAPLKRAREEQIFILGLDAPARRTSRCSRTRSGRPGGACLGILAFSASRQPSAVARHANDYLGCRRRCPTTHLAGFAAARRCADAHDRTRVRRSQRRNPDRRDARTTAAGANRARHQTRWVGDVAGHASYANRDVWVGGGEDWWFSANNEDRMEVLPERSHYEPGGPRACGCGCRFGPRPRWSLSSVKALFSALSNPVWSFTRH